MNLFKAFKKKISKGKINLHAKVIAMTLILLTPEVEVLHFWYEIHNV